eukprot:TRINITY_DN17319_c0_g2_i2.p1 TRINITY_DN17319_c0_g2~~TRINITY_DN17319_c0_g2_i2.p1  ORF type:complete len:263 (-),score=44.48 TRINITY_DN17319_c0_g2_i2:455-1243(-)
MKDNFLTKQSAQQRLEQLGQQFLSMFEDESEERRQPLKKRKKQRQTQESIDNDDEKQNESKSPQSKCENVDEIDLLINIPNQKVRSKQKKKKQQKQQAAEEDQIKLQKNVLKRIRRGKSEALFEDGLPKHKRRRQRKSADKNDQVDVNFKQIWHEVGQFGATQLQRKDKNIFKGNVISQLGGQAKKSHRIPKSVGLERYKRNKQVQKQWEQEALNTGMISKQKLVKMRQRQKERDRDFGLQEAGGFYKPGILKLNQNIATTK